MQRQGGNVQNPGGEPFGFIGVTDAMKATVRLDLHAYHDLPQRHTAGYALTIPILSFERLTGRFAPLGGPGLIMSMWNTDKKMHPLPV